MMSTLFKAGPRKSLVATVEDEIRAALIEGRLPPGTRLVTKEIATSLGMSITPVREALVRFAASAVLTAEPASSFRVPTLTAAQYVELVKVRKANEGLAAAEAAMRIGPERIAEMRRTLEAYLVAKREDRVHDALKLNKDFRFILYEAAGMPTLLGVIEMLWLRVGPVFNTLYEGQVRSSSEHGNYDVLLTALEDRDRAGAREAIEHAIDDGGAQVLRVLSEREAAPQEVPRSSRQGRT